MKRTILRLTSILVVAAMVGVSCTPDDDLNGDSKKTGEVKVEVTTADATDVESTKAKLNALCSLTDADGAKGVAVFYYTTINGNADSIKIEGEKVLSDTIAEGLSSFSAIIENLEPETKYYYVACVIINGKEYYGQVKTLNTGEALGKQPNGDFVVDLGLSVKWATCNVGAEKSEDYGDYYAWGEIETKSTYNWSTYKYSNGSDTSLTKYCDQSYCGNNGYTDSKTILEMSDDVAHQKWGGSWRMPTKDEFIELLNNCIWIWTIQNGVNGYKVTSNKAGYTDRSIFLPAAGCIYETSLDLVGFIGFYWSSSLSTGNPYYAWKLDIDSINHCIGNNTRDCGRSVRPVCP